MHFFATVAAFSAILSSLASGAVLERRTAHCGKLEPSCPGGMVIQKVECPCVKHNTAENGKWCDLWRCGKTEKDPMMVCGHKGTGCAKYSTSIFGRAAAGEE